MTANTTNHLDPKQNRGAEPWREPTVSDGDTVLFSECGRVLDCDYRSHWYLLAKPQCGPVQLLVSHGGGSERIILDYVVGNNVSKSLSILDSNTRYLLMGALFEVHENGKRSGIEQASTEYRAAFVDGRLRKRRLPSRNLVKVWIEPKPKFPFSA